MDHTLKGHLPFAGIGFQYGFNESGFDRPHQNLPIHAASRPGDSHPESLPEPDVNLSAHPAPLPRRRPHPWPVCKQMWFALGHPTQPVFGSSRVMLQLLVFPRRPSDQRQIDVPQKGI